REETSVCHHRPRILSSSLKIIAAVAVLGIFLLGAAIPGVEAGIGGSDTPTFPTAVTVGQQIGASLTIINLSTTPSDTENVKLVSLILTPSCGSSALTPICVDPNLDPGVFQVLSAVGDGGTTPCAGTIFQVSSPTADAGQVTLTPMSDVILGPAT